MPQLHGPWFPFSRSPTELLSICFSVHGIKYILEPRETASVLVSSLVS